MKRHPELGWALLQRVDYLRPASAIVLQHQEKWDGTGYPAALKAQDIVLGARVFHVVDTLDAITSDRPYRRPAGSTTRRDEIVRCGGTQFDPKVVEAFLTVAPRGLGAYPARRRDGRGAVRRPRRGPARARRARGGAALGAAGERASRSGGASRAPLWSTLAVRKPPKATDPAAERPPAGARGDRSDRARGPVHVPRSRCLRLRGASAASGPRSRVAAERRTRRPGTRARHPLRAARRGLRPRRGGAGRRRRGLRLDRSSPLSLALSPRLRLGERGVDQEVRTVA